MIGHSGQDGFSFLAGKSFQSSRGSAPNLDQPTGFSHFSFTLALFFARRVHTRNLLLISHRKLPVVLTFETLKKQKESDKNTDSKEPA